MLHSGIKSFSNVLGAAGSFGGVANGKTSGHGSSPSKLGARTRRELDEDPWPSLFSQQWRFTTGPSTLVAPSYNTEDGFHGIQRTKHAISPSYPGAHALKAEALHLHLHVSATGLMEK